MLMSLDVENLFTNEPVIETIDTILNVYKNFNLPKTATLKYIFNIIYVFSYLSSTITIIQTTLGSDLKIYQQFKLTIVNDILNENTDEIKNTIKYLKRTQLSISLMSSTSLAESFLLT